MPTFLGDALGALIRWGLTLLLGGLVTHGIWTQVQFDNLAVGLTGAILVLAWSLWQKYGAIWWQHVALSASPATTPTQLAQKVDDGVITGPPVTKVVTGALGMLLAIAVAGGAMALPACSVSARHTAVIADVSIHGGLAALQDGEMAMFKANELSSDPANNAALHKQINKALVPALKSEDAFNRAIRNWQPGQPTPVELQQHVADLRSLLNEVTGAFPDGAAKSKLLGWITVAQNAALAVIVNLPAK
jgi:hypothetical protein